MLKTLQCLHDEGFVVVKVYIKKKDVRQDSLLQLVTDFAALLLNRRRI